MCSLSRFLDHHQRPALNSSRITIIIAAMLLASCSQVRELPPSGSRIVFFGDSITEQGDKPNGYVSLLRDTLKSSSRETFVEVIGAGISGNKVPDLLERIDRDVLARRPTVVVVYIGINDVWHSVLLSGKGTPKDEYEDGLSELLAKITETGAHAMLCTPSVIGERYDGSNKLDTMLEEYCAISRSVAARTGVPLCDLRKSFVEYLKTNNPENKEFGILTSDSVHLNAAGNRLVAAEILRALQQSKLIGSQR